MEDLCEVIFKSLSAATITNKNINLIFLIPSSNILPKFSLLTVTK
jgi:hypothetical protein